jgi:hypothetical protein
MFILATSAALFLKRSAPQPVGAHHAFRDAMDVKTRSRDATRRLWASRIHDAYFDPSPMGLTKRHRQSSASY